MSLVTLCFNTSMCISMCQAIADNHGYVGIDQETVLINRKNTGSMSPVTLCLNNTYVQECVMQ